MNERTSPVLVIAATSRELRSAGDVGHAGPPHIKCGVGPVEAAAATAAAIAKHKPLAIVHIGIAGARDFARMPAGTIVIGTEARYEDVGSSSDWAPHRAAPSHILLDAAVRALPGALQLPIGTSARVGGTSECPVEAMEGFAVLRAAELAGVPAIEVRAISNEIAEQDRSRWKFDIAFAALAEHVPRLIHEVERCVR